MPLPLSKLCPDFDARIAVFRAIDAPVSELTVADLCNRAGITRKRFYTLFEGKEDVFRWYLDLVFNASLYEVGRSLTWGEGVRSCLSYIADERKVFAASYGGHCDPASRYWVLKGKRVDEMIRTLKDNGVHITTMLDLEMDLYSSAVPTLIRRWVTAPDALTLDAYTACWIDCVPTTLKEALELKPAR